MSVRYAVLMFVSVIVTTTSGCSSVTPIGPSRFMVTKQGLTIFSNTGGLLAAAQTEAQEYCGKKGRYSVTETWASTPNAQGIPGVILNARCVSAEQARAHENASSTEIRSLSAPQQNVNINVR